MTSEQHALIHINYFKVLFYKLNSGVMPRLLVGSRPSGSTPLMADDVEDTGLRQRRRRPWGAIRRETRVNIHLSRSPDTRPMATHTPTPAAQATPYADRSMPAVTSRGRPIHPSRDACWCAPRGPSRPRLPISMFAPSPSTVHRDPVWGCRDETLGSKRDGTNDFEDRHMTRLPRGMRGLPVASFLDVSDIDDEHAYIL